MAIDVDGTANGASFINLAVVRNITGLTDEAALKTNGVIII